MSTKIAITNAEPLTDSKTLVADAMTQLHVFKVVTDGVAQVVHQSAMGPVGSGRSAFEAAPVEPLLTVAEQKAKTEAQAAANG